MFKSLVLLLEGEKGRGFRLIRKWHIWGGSKEE